MTRCPVERVDGGYELRGHSVVRQVALDDVTYSSAVSRFLQVPNGMDGEEHDRFRALTDRYLTDERVRELEPRFTEIAAGVVSEAIDRGGTADAVGLGAQFAVRASSAWLGWPGNLEAELLDWVRANWEATRSGEFSRTAAVAAWYNSIISGLIRTRRAQPHDDVTAELMNDDFLGRALTHEEITSILRNWTGGDLGSMALSIGVILAYLADHPDLQEHLRSGEVSVRQWHLILDEILRLDDPFVANRRVAMKDVQLAGEHIREGERLFLNWTAANQDPEVFSEFDPEGNAEHNLVYGVGRHVCPGRELATEQLRIFTEVVLGRTSQLAPGAQERTRSAPPAGGYTEVPIRLLPLAELNGR